MELCDALEIVGTGEFKVVMQDDTDLIVLCGDWGQAEALYRVIRGCQDEELAIESDIAAMEEAFDLAMTEKDEEVALSSKIAQAAVKAADESAQIAEKAVEDEQAAEKKVEKAMDA